MDRRELHQGTSAVIFNTNVRKNAKQMKTENLQLSDDIANDCLSDVSISKLMNEATEMLINYIYEKRNKIIAERLKQVLGIDLDIKSEATLRFKRLAIEYKGNEETVYFNDGSEQGKRIVTFVKKKPTLSFDANNCQMIGECYYYY